MADPRPAGSEETWGPRFQLETPPEERPEFWLKTSSFYVLLEGGDNLCGRSGQTAAACCAGECCQVRGQEAQPWRPDDEYLSQELFDIISCPKVPCRAPTTIASDLRTSVPSLTHRHRAGEIRLGHGINFLAENGR